MKEIEKDAAVQKEVHHPNDPNFEQEPQDFREEEEVVLNKDQIMTFEDLMGQDEEQNGETSDTNEDEFHLQFIKELKRKEMLENLRQENN